MTEVREMPKDERLERMRHSAAHIMAEVVLEMFPQAKLDLQVSEQVKLREEQRGGPPRPPWGGGTRRPPRWRPLRSTPDTVYDESSI